MISKITTGGFTLCQMGEGTLFGGVVKNEKEQPVGISFSNDPQSLQGSVVFQINSIEGIAGYMLPLIALMEEWRKVGYVKPTDEIEENEFIDAIQSLNAVLEPYRPKAKE